MKNYICLIFFIFISSQAFASGKLGTSDKVDYEENIVVIDIDDIKSKIASFLSPKDHAAFTHLNRDFRRCLFNTPGSIGESLRKKTDFSIKIDDRHYFLEEFIGISTLGPTRLNQETGALSIDTRPQLSNRFRFEVKNIAQLVKEKPEDFKKLVLASIPKTPDDIENNLVSYYEESMKINDLIKGLPVYDDPREKLANYLVEYSIEDHIRDQIWDQVWDNTNPQDGRHVWNQIGSHNRHVLNHLRNQLGELTWDQVADPIRDHIGRQLGYELLDQVWVQEESDQDVWNQEVGDQEREGQVDSVLTSNFDFTSASEPQEMIRLLESAIDYTFMVYQLTTISRI